MHFLRELSQFCLFCHKSGTIRLASSILSYAQCLPVFRTNEACVKASRRLVQVLGVLISGCGSVTGS